jgi:hypothetical protein
MGMNVAQRAERREKIAKDLEGGKSIEEVMRLYGVSYSAVYALARSLGKSASLSIKHATRARDFRILALLLKGDTPLKIAADHSYDQDLVENISSAAKAAGIINKENNAERSGRPSSSSSGRTGGNRKALAGT